MKHLSSLSFLAAIVATGCRETPAPAQPAAPRSAAAASAPASAAATDAAPATDAPAALPPGNEAQEAALEAGRAALAEGRDDSVRQFAGAEGR
ncbi:MAG: hypothetical protein R3F43_19820 [bacterium]